MDSFSNWLTQYLLQKKFIAQNQVEWCHYMVVHRAMNIVSLILLIPIGALIVGWCESTIFTLCLRFIRSRTGGYHAHTSIGCLFSSTIAQILFLSLLPILFNIYVLLFVLTISTVVVLLLAPANNAALHLSLDEMHALKPRIILRLLTVIAGSLGSLWISESLAGCFALAIAGVAVLLVFSKLGYGAQ